MNTTFLKQLKSHLPEQSWPWVIAALRQDTLVWETIQTNSSFLQAPTDADQIPECWNPARVAFLMLQQAVPSPNTALSLGLRQRAFRTYEAVTQHYTATQDDSQPMVKAALLAVALRERLRLVGKWDNLPDELSVVQGDIWRTPLACLYGLIEKPLELLRSLLTPSASTEIHNLAIHALLSNPLTPETQVNCLLGLVKDLPISSREKILWQLSSIHPELAVKLAQQISTTTQSETSNLPLDDLVSHYNLAEIAFIAGDSEQAAKLINSAQENARKVQANLAAQSAQISRTPLTFWQKAFELAPEEPAYRSNLALAYLDLQNTAEANAILDPVEVKDQPDLLYASAQLAHITGDDERARQHVSEALSVIEKSTNEISSHKRNSTSLALKLGQSLLKLNLPFLAIRAARISMQERPDDPERLILMGKAQTAAGQHTQAAEAYQWAVLLAPQKFELHRDLAQSLEAAGEWAMALEERKISASVPSSPIDDQYKLADCAIHNNQAAYAADICRVILTKDPKDGLAHTLLGEALAAVGDLPAAQVHFTQASELAPDLPRPWLALARTLNQCNQPQKALETLRVASQAIPRSAEIHQVLGEHYLSVNAPTQALEAFEHAAEIDPRNIPIALRLGQTLYQLGHLPQAREVLKQAYQQEPENTDVAFTYAQILMGQDEPMSALPALATVIASNPVEPAPFVDYARAILLTHGDAAKATEALYHALELTPNHAEAQAFLGESLAAENKLEASLQAYQTALETPLAQNDEWHARLSYGLGGVALKLEKIEIAIASSLESARLDPQNYHPHCQLAEAYQAAGLIPDAYQSTCEALRLAGDDIQVMLWYVEKTLELAGNKPALLTGATQQHPRHEELRIQALQTLKRAAEIAPDQASIFLRIANIQSEAGDYASAASNLRRITTIKSATPVELQQAAELLLDLDDPVGAVSCFEKASEKVLGTSDNGELRIRLLSQLANAYRQAHNPQAALQSIESAINLSPDDGNLLCVKAELLFELGQSKSAISFIKETISRVPDPRLYRCASIIHQKEGNLLDALELAEIGALLPNTSSKPKFENGQLECAVLAAEQARAILQPDRAQQILKKQSIYCSNENCPTFSDFHVVCVEIALDKGDEIEASNFLSNALKDNDTLSPRLQALQTRFTALRGDYPTALTIYQAALQNLGDNETGNSGFLKTQEEKETQLQPLSHPIPITPASTLYTFTEAAIRLNLWGNALRLAQKAEQIAPAEPLAHLNLAHVLVQRAEFQYLCNDSDLVGNAPGPVALSEGTSRVFEQAIQETRSICEGISQRSHNTLILPELERWYIRGKAVFSPSPDTVKSLSDWAMQSSNQEDLAASLAALRRVSIENEQQVLDSNQRSGAVLTQIALMFAEKNPEESIKTLQKAIMNEPIRNTHNAIRHYLLARLAHQLYLPTSSTAIQTAITSLPDEPRWYALAAKISLASGDKSNAIGYLEKAIQLEPRHVEHHLALGQLYLHYAGDSNATEALQAAKSFERACRLAPEHPEAWLLLARAHRITGNLDQAAAAAEQSTTLAPDISASHLIQAEIALQCGNLQSAHDHAQVALQLQPDSQQAAMILSRALQALKRPAEALAVIDKAIPVSEQTLSLMIERIQLIRQAQGAKTALQAADELTQMNPDDPAVLALLAEVQADAGEDETAIRTAQKAILLSENLSTSQQANLRLLLGKLLRRAGQLDQAVHHLDEVIRMMPEKIEALLELGRTHQDRRQLAQALLMYRRAASIMPHDPRPYLQAGLALKEGKDYVESESMLRRAADLAPNDTTIRRQLAAVIAINLVHNPHRSIQTESV